MNLTGALGDFQHLLSGSGRRNPTRYTRLERLIGALEKKEALLEKRLDRETDAFQRRHLTIELKVTRMQLAKGTRRLRELQKNPRAAYIASHRPTTADVID